jgi:hypothetical protein
VCVCVEGGRGVNPGEESKFSGFSLREYKRERWPAESRKVVLLNTIATLA